MHDFIALTKALSDPIRIRLLIALRGGELCVGDLVAIINGPQPTISRHLAYLRKTGLVANRGNGPWIFYRLTPARSASHKKLLECLEQCFDDVKEVRADAARAAKLRKSGGCCPRSGW